MRDKLEQFLDDYDKGRISIDELQRRIDYIDWSQSRPMTVPNDYMETPRDPVDVLIAKEEHNTLVIVLQNLRASLPEDDWQMFVMTAKGMTQNQIANALGYTRSAVIRHLQRIGKDVPVLRTLLHKESS